MTVLAPVVILTIWGASYVWACVLALSAPGRPVKLDYKTPGGVLYIRAESYAVDWDRGTVHVGDLKVAGPDGKTIATAGDIVATGVYLPNPKVINVNVRDVKATVVRLKGGKFDIQDYLPEQEGPPSQIPFAVNLNRADVTIIDRAGGTDYRKLATVLDLDVRGVGEDWIAGASVDLGDTGSVRAELQNLPKSGFMIRGRTAGLQLAPILEHLRGTGDLKNATFLDKFHVGSLKAFGPVSVFIPKEKGFEVQTNLKALATDVRYDRYSAQQAYFDGLVTQNSARGQLDARDGATKASFNGSIVWQSEIVLGGKLVASTPSRGSLPSWVQELIPSDVRFANARWDGWLDFRPGTGIRLQGDVDASTVDAYDQSIDQPRLAVDLDGRRLRLGIQSGAYAGAPIKGALLVGIDDTSLTGAITATKVNLRTVGSRFGAKGLAGTADVSLLIGGVRTDPTVVMQARGNGTYRVNGKPITGRFQVAGNYSNDVLNIDRARVGSAAGSVRAIGRVSLKNRTLSLNIDATNIQLQKLREDILGNINVSGVLQGRLSDPRFKGKAMALGLQVGGQDIPFVSANLVGNKGIVSANDVQVIKGTGQASGNVAVNLKTKGLSGSLSADNVLLNEYLGEEALGVVRIPELTLAGTYESPRLAGTAYGDDLIFGGIRVDHAEIATSLKGSVATIESATAKIGEGSVTATGKYDYNTKIGLLNAKADKLALSRITPPGKGSANITGTLDGQASIGIAASGTMSGKAKGTLQAVSLNGTDFGSGNWNLNYDGRDVTGDASVGLLDRFLLLERVKFDTEARTIDAQVSVLNGSIQDLYASTRPFFPDLSYDLRQRLDTAQGDVDTTVEFSGSINNPDFKVVLLEGRNLQLQGQALGGINAQFSKVGTAWNIGNFRWTGAKDENDIQSVLVIRPGFIDSAGDLSVDADLTNFDLRYIGIFDPSWARLTGYASASVFASGKTESPVIRGSLENTEKSSVTIGGTGESFRVNLNAITMSKAVYSADGTYSGGITARGLFFYRGLTGNIQAHLPLNYPFGIPDGPQITASLTFPDVPLADMAQYATFLDIDRSVGNLNGSITIGGPKSNLAVSGSVVGNAETLAVQGIETTFHAVVADVRFQNNEVLLKLNAQSSNGGDVSANLTAMLPDLKTAIDRAAKGDDTLIERTPVQGEFVANNVVIREDAKKSKNKEFGTYHATINSKLAVSGPAIEPKISGRVGVSDTNILLPSVFEGAGPSAEMLFNPHFEIALNLDETAQFRTSTADVALTGGGNLGGSLSRPQFNGTLVVERGRLSLPTARIRLEEGGTLRPSYSVNSSGDSSARVDVNLQGRTSVTSVRFGDTVQRYDIRLDITGDLLQEGGLNLNATSDPPDLSKDEILALLGKTDVLQTIGSASGFSQSETEKRIRDALVSVAVPTLTENITAAIASNLGLEYLNIDYNAIEGASLSFAKVLGKGVVLQGRRQITQVVGNRKLDYDLRLTYRLPTRNTNLSRVVFSIGLDQDRPYKLGIEYGFRF